jgi:hypothetical protein
MTGRWNAPLDPECPEWSEALSTLWDDPMTAYSGVGDEVQDDMEARHRRQCERCQEYGAENIEVV